MEKTCESKNTETVFELVDRNCRFIPDILHNIFNVPREKKSTFLIDREIYLII